MARKDGKRLERVIELIETLAANTMDVTVTAPKFLKDKDTGRRREHDVVISYNTGHHGPLIVALECRDRSRPVTVEAVEAFHTKCQRTGVHHGIIVSSKGFANSAKLKADSLGLRCLSLGEAQQFDWCQTPGVVSRTRKLTCLYVGVNVPATAKKPWTLCEEGMGGVPGRTQLGPQELNRMAFNLLEYLQNSNKASELDLVGRPIQCVANAPVDNFVVIDADGFEHKVRSLQITMEFVIEEEFVPLTFSNYSDSISGEILKSAANAFISLNGEEWAVVISGNPDGPKYVAMKKVGEVVL